MNPPRTTSGAFTDISKPADCPLQCGVGHPESLSYPDGILHPGVRCGAAGPRGWGVLRFPTRPRFRLQ